MHGNTGPDLPPIHVVGLGLTGELREAEAAVVAQADALAGGKRQLALFPYHRAQRIQVGSPLERTLAWLKVAREGGQRIAVLADGDPLFFGFGRRLLQAFGPEALVFHPGVTALAGAAARLGIPWDGLPVVSVHGRDDWAALGAALAGSERVAVYAGGANDPAAIARELIRRGAGKLVRLHVCEDLDAPGERVRTLGLEEAATLDFSQLALAVAEKLAPPELPLGLGLPDESLAHEAGLITKREVRAAALALLRVLPGDTVWDLGAGSGAVALEAAALARNGRVLAVERDAGRLKLIRENVRRTHAFHVEVVAGAMPACLEELPAPDKVFLGGGLSQGDAVLEAACARLAPGGRIVVAAVLLGTLERARAVFARLGWPVELLQVQAARGGTLAGDVRLVPGNPVFLLAGARPDAATGGEGA